ncbi:hypothetical protein BY458DRAFT_498379 [Sporodiniella umbellata]|nr:hypothetical protein BY458DRAFT_498379 [Sporodiniella umbellata]
MGAQVVDYRVSTLIVLCKDCNSDVGLYPARHKCVPVNNSAMPLLSLETTAETSNPSNIPPVAKSRWRSLRERNPPVQSVNENTNDSIYLDSFVQNLSEINDNTSTTGKKLWGRVRNNDKWKQLTEKNEKASSSGKLWEKLLQATHTIAEKSPKDDRGAESDEDDWEGETHVARILREHYEKSRKPLPNWLYDRGDLNQSQSYGKNVERALSFRDKELMELRQRSPPPLPNTHENNSRLSRPTSLRNRSSERRPSRKDQLFETPASVREQSFERYSHNSSSRSSYKEMQDYEQYRRPKLSEKDSGSYERSRDSTPPHNRRNGFYEGDGLTKDYSKEDYFQISTSPSPSLARYPGSLRRVPDAGRGELGKNKLNHF